MAEVVKPLSQVGFRHWVNLRVDPGVNNPWTWVCDGFEEELSSDHLPDRIRYRVREGFRTNAQVLYDAYKAECRLRKNKELDKTEFEFFFTLTFKPVKKDGLDMLGVENVLEEVKSHVKY